MRAAFGIALVAPLLVATVVQGAAQKQSTLPSAIAVGFFVDGAQSGSGILSDRVLVISPAAHLASVEHAGGNIRPSGVLPEGHVLSCRRP